MAQFSLSLRLKCLLIRHPVLANRLMGALGARRVENIARRAAIRAARRAYAQVPYYHELFKAHGFDDARMQRLTWEDFNQLPPSDKVQTSAVRDSDLLDSHRMSPTEDALIGRSSGTSSAPVFWPLGWEEFAFARASFWRWLRDVGADRRRTAVVVAMAVDGADLAGQMPLFSLFSAKETTHWPFQTFPGGENPTDLVVLMRWLIQQHYEVLVFAGFPGSIERLLDRVAELRATDPESSVDWSAFQRIRLNLGGQLVAASLRRRIEQEMTVNPFDLIPVYASSDTGQFMFQSTPFTIWLERYLAIHPDLYAALGIGAEHQSKPLMECITPLAAYSEQDEENVLLLTVWKHRPLIRYDTHDLVWLRPAYAIIGILDREAHGWRRDFKAEGYGGGFIPRVTALGIILGRADDVCIVNAANIAPEILQAALEASGVLKEIHHFKHYNDESRPNVYEVYLELNDTVSEMERTLLAATWKPQLLAALLTQPASTDLAAAHRANPIELQLFVRSRGQAEFDGDDQSTKKRYVPRPQRRIPAVEVSTDSDLGVSDSLEE
jgi:phenylacetate-coenzyme A ligase PaaK-like adenylate-forming protein